MKKKHLVGLTIFFSLCLITFACRKEIEYFVHGREKAPSMLVESAKMWHLRNLTTRDPNLRLIPRWNDAWVINTSKGTRVVVPAPERHINNNNINIRRFVILKVSGNSITDGQIVEFLGEKYNVSGNIDLLLEKYESGKIPDFTGAVMQYDINYYPISTTSYNNGAKDKRVAMVLNYNGNSLKKKTKQDLQEIALLRSPTTKLGKSNASVSYCPDPDVEYNGVPPGLADDCLVTFYVRTYWDNNGCAWLITWDYMSHSCPGGSDNGSGSGSAGGNGSGSGGWNNGGPPYGGGGSGSEGSTAAALAEFNRKIDAQKLLDCMKSILNRIQGLSGNTVANIINNFSGDVPRYDWNVAMKHFDIGVNGETEWDKVTKKVTTYMNSNTTVIENASDLAIAKTLIHESVHAYLSVELSTDFDTAKKTYPELINFWGTAKKNQNAAQHELFVKDFANDIANTLKLYGESRGYNLPDQFYSDMSWGALTETEAFKKLSVEDQTRIRNVTKAEQYKIETNEVTQKGTDAGC